MIQFGPPRTGSTLVWNAIRALFPDQTIPKRHDLTPLHLSPLCRSRFVVTVRDPLDIVVSMLGIAGMDPTPEAVGIKIEEITRQGMVDAIRMKDHPRSLVLRYEDFYNAFDPIFEPLEAFLGRRLDPVVRDNFERRFAIEAVRRRAGELDGFEDFDADDQIHGRHISEQSGRPGYHAEILDKEAINRIRDAFPVFFTAFGY